MDVSFVDHKNLMELSKDDLIAEYAKVLKKLEAVNKAYDEKLQENHTLSNQYKFAQDIKMELESDNEILQQKVCQLASLQNEIHEEKVAQKVLSDKLQEKIDQLSNAYNEISLLKKANMSCIEENHKDDHNHDHLVAKLKAMDDDKFELEEKIVDLQASNERLENNVTSLTNQLGAMKETLKEHQKEIHELKNIIEEKNREIRSYKEKHENDFEEITVLRSENDLLKSTNQDHKQKGNSLFAEVEDKRQQLISNQKMLHNEVTVLKKEALEYARRIHELKMENLEIYNKWKDVKYDCTAKHHFYDAERLRNQSLTVQISNVKDELKNVMFRLENSSVADVKNVARGFAEFYRKSVDDLRQTIESQSVSLHLSQITVAQAKCEAAAARQEAMRNKGELECYRNSNNTMNHKYDVDIKVKEEQSL